MNNKTNRKNTDYVVNIHNTYILKELVSFAPGVKKMKITHIHWFILNILIAFTNNIFLNCSST